MHPDVLTVTLNPAIDQTVFISRLLFGKDCLAKKIFSTAGGKGINVARALKGFGIKAHVTGFAGGVNGQRFLRDLILEKMEPNFVFIDGETRCNLTIHDEQRKRLTRILEAGPKITAKDLASFRNKFSRLVEKSQWVILSGRGIAGTPADFYRELIRIAQNKGKKVAFDASGKDLRGGLKAKPFFLKINRSEAETVLKQKLKNRSDYKKALKKFLGLGIQQIVITLASQGAVGANHEGFWQAFCPKVKAVNTVGCGDSLLAGFIYATIEGSLFKDALAMGVAAGTTSALSLTPGNINQPQLEAIVQQILVKEI